MKSRWTVQLNDLVGGWVVTDYPQSLADHPRTPSGGGLARGRVIADCVTEADAQRIAHLLNEDEA